MAWVFRILIPPVKSAFCKDLMQGQITSTSLSRIINSLLLQLSLSSAYGMPMD